MATKVRRVVTAQNARGRSYILSDDIATNAQEMKTVDRAHGHPISGRLSRRRRATRALPTARPGRCAMSRPRAARCFASSNSRPTKCGATPSIPTRRSARSGGHTRVKDSADPLMHKSTTIDYIIVIKGEMYAVMDEGEVLLKPGDVLVQRGTNHSWSNRSDAPCLIAAILIDAKPI